MEEPFGPLCGKIKKISPHIPYYLAEGNTVVRKWTEAFVDRLGNKATLTKIEYKTKPKKGKKEKIIEAVIQVRWE